ncbi:MAG TPA: hypothetical protein VI197_14380 [Polyangiaceae bacterium]
MDFLCDFTQRLRRCSAYVVMLALTLPSGCTEVPPNLPTSEAFKRNVPRIELVPLVIGDSERAERVQRLYIEIESLMLAAQRAQTEQWRALLEAKTRKLADDEVRAIVRKFRDAEIAALRKYVGIQLRLREATTPEEFAKLDALK